MARRKKKTSAPPKPRSTLHEILKGRKSARHKRDSEKRAGQKFRRELEEG